MYLQSTNIVSFWFLLKYNLSLNSIEQSAIQKKIQNGHELKESKGWLLLSLKQAYKYLTGTNGLERVSTN